jgi:hypothetical protein
MDGNTISEAKISPLTSLAERSSQPNPSTSFEVILEAKLNFVSSLAYTLMFWWASSVAFCGSLIAAVWIRRDDLRSFHELYLFCAVVWIFIFTIAIFGCIMIPYTYKLKKEAIFLIRKIPGCEGLRLPEFDIITTGLIAGSSSFVFALIVWCGIWRLYFS